MIAKPKPYEKAVFLGRSASTAMQQAWLDRRRAGRSPPDCGRLPNSKLTVSGTRTTLESCNTIRKTRRGLAASAGGFKRGCDSMSRARRRPRCSLTLQYSDNTTRARRKSQAVSRSAVARGMPECGGMSNCEDCRGPPSKPVKCCPSNAGPSPGPLHPEIPSNAHTL